MNDQSIKDRLKNLGRKEGKNFDELLMRYTIERFLYRLSVSPHREHFVLKGGALLYTLFTFSARVTKDIDVLARHISNSHAQVCEIITDICQIEIDDALRFHPPLLKDIESITEDADYHGVRVKFNARLGRTVIRLQMDIGFSDTPVPPPEEIQYPSLLSMESPNLWGYAIETVIAEKYQAIISLGEQNSRYKDFYDIWQLSRTYQINGNPLKEAIAQTFKDRHTEFHMTIYQPNFHIEKEKHWRAFLQRINAPINSSFAEIIQELKVFLLPIHNSCIEQTPFHAQWDTTAWR